MSTDPPRPAPRLLSGLLDDAAMFPPGGASLADAFTGHRAYRTGPYAPLVGPLLVPAVELAGVGELAGAGQAAERADAGRAVELARRSGGVVDVGVIGARPELVRALHEVPPGVSVTRIEAPVAKRGEDPLPGLVGFVAAIGEFLVDGVTAHAELPLTGGLMSALDRLAQLRERQVPVAAKFRTGGLAAELFPTPAELAGVICACRDRGLPFKLTAGLHHAVRHRDPRTGLIHHGFVNVLVATAAAAAGAGPADVAQTLASTDALVLAEAARARLDEERLLWIGFGTCDLDEPIAELRALGLLAAGVWP